MHLPTVFETCVPREDVLAGTIADADFAADLAKVIRGNASDDYQQPARFFANTYPTQGLNNLLRNVLARLTGDSSAAAGIFRLDTSYGGKAKCEVRSASVEVETSGPFDITNSSFVITAGLRAAYSRN